MRKHNRFLVLLICVSLAFLVSCMNGKEEQAKITEEKTESVLAEAIETETPETEAKATSAPVTTSPQEAEKLVEYTREFYYDLMYETDEKGNWSGFGEYILNFEAVGDAETLLLSRSREAYNEVKSQNLYKVFDAFQEDIKQILQEAGVEYTEFDLALGYLKLKQGADVPVTTAIPVVTTTALPLPQTRLEPTTSTPVTTAIPEVEPTWSPYEYSDEILIDIMYSADEEGNWSGLGKYISNSELLGEAEEHVILRSKMAYDEVMSILSVQETERTLVDAYNSFRNGIKLILYNNGIEYTENDVVGYEILKLK